MWMWLWRNRFPGKKGGGAALPLEALTMSINVSAPMGIAKYPSLAAPGWILSLSLQICSGWNIVAAPQLGQEHGPGAGMELQLSAVS